MANEVLGNYTVQTVMSPEQFQGGAKGTLILTGTSELTGVFAGFKALGDTVIAAVDINGVEKTPAAYFGSASISDSIVMATAYAKGEYITAITLTSGSLLMIKAD